jgi:hypothetical protein
MLPRWPWRCFPQPRSSSCKCQCWTLCPFARTFMSSVRLRVSAVRWLWRLRRGPVHGGGPLSSLQHNWLPNEFNQVNHPISTQWNDRELSTGQPFDVVSGLDQTVTNGVAHQTRCFVDIEFLHESRSVRFGSFYTDPQVHGDIFRGLSFTD